MSTYRYVATHIRTGAALADSVPLTVASFSRNLNGSGSLNGTLNLQVPDTLNVPFLEALETRRCVLWVLQDDYPVWAGVVWDSPLTSLAAKQVPITAQSLESVFDHREISATLLYSAVDMFEVFCDLAKYGLSKTSPFIAATSPTPAPSATVTAAAAVPQIAVPTGARCGVPWTATYAYSDFRKVSDVFTDLAASGNLEWALEPALDANGNLIAMVRLGYTQLGRPAHASGITLTYPGNAVDYGYPQTGSQGANYLWVTAPPNGSAASWLSQYPHGVDLDDLAAGYPLMEDSASWGGSTVTSQAQVDAYADAQVMLKTQAMTTPTVTIGGGSWPGLKDIVLGDSAAFAATSARHPAQADGTPGLQVTLRVTGWTCTPPADGQQETIQLTTSPVGAT